MPNVNHVGLAKCLPVAIYICLTLLPATNNHNHNTKEAYMASTPKEAGTKVVLTDLSDNNYTFSKELTYWAQADGEERDFAILYDYRREGDKSTANLITLNAEEIEQLAFVFGYVKES